MTDVEWRARRELLPPSEFRLPNSAFRVPPSEFLVPRSEFRLSSHPRTAVESGMPELPSTKPEHVEPLPNEEVRNLFTAALECSAKEAAELLAPYPDAYVETVLEL